MSKTQTTVEIDVEILNETDLAILISDGDKEVWIPKSHIIEPIDDFDIGKYYTITIPEWLAFDKELI